MALNNHHNMTNVSKATSYKTWLGNNQPPSNAKRLGFGHSTTKMPNTARRHHVGGLGLNGANEAGIVPVFSAALSEFDFYDSCKNAPGIPLWANREHAISPVGEEIRADVCSLNYMLEKVAIAVEQPAKSTNGKRSASDGSIDSLFRESYDPKERIWGSVGYTPAVLYPLPPFVHGRARTLGNQAYGFMESEDEWINYGDASTDFHRKWQFNGITQNATDSSSFASERSSDYWLALGKATQSTRSISLGVCNDVQVRNLFTVDPRRGDFVYFVLAPQNLGKRGKNIMRPNGETGEPGFMGNCLQLRGVSSGTGFDNCIPMQSWALREQKRVASRGVPSNKNVDHSIESDYRLDIDYVLKTQILRREGQIIEETERGTFIARPTDDLLDVPESIVDIYTLGLKPIKIGMILQHPDARVSEVELAEAHRNAKKQAQLPLMQVLLGSGI